MDVQKLIEAGLEKFNNKEYLFEKVDGKYTAIRFDDFVFRARALATMLVEKGLLGQRIMLVGKNSINLIIADVAVTVYTGVCVNAAAGTKADELDGQIGNLGVKTILYTNEQAEKIAELKSEIEKINIDEAIPRLEKIGTTFKAYNPDECTKIVFTGGTTSKPKGVMLSFRNMFYGWPYLRKRAPFEYSDIVYLFLPLHHTYANVYLFYYSLISGLSIYLCSDVDKIPEELLEVRPTIFCAVPLIYQRIADAYHGDVSGAFGGRTRFLFAGGAPIDQELKNVYKRSGLEILNAYALSETASSFAIDYPGDTDEDDVGAIFEDLEVKTIDADENGVGEICVKGDCIFLGYTSGDADCFTDDGFFRTGDLGFVKNNKLFIVGRKKKVLIGSNGENIYPEDLLEIIKGMDGNVNDVRFSLRDNRLYAEFFLDNAEKTNLSELVESFNAKRTGKDRIMGYELSSHHQNEKLLD